MKKLIKNEICGSMNSAQMHCSLEKVNICGYCSCNSAWTVTAFLQKRVKKKKTQNADGETQTCYPNYPLSLSLTFGKLHGSVISWPQGDLSSPRDPHGRKSRWECWLCTSRLPCDLKACPGSELLDLYTLLPGLILVNVFLPAHTHWGMARASDKG